MAGHVNRSGHSVMPVRARYRLSVRGLHERQPSGAAPTEPRLVWRGAPIQRCANSWADVADNGRRARQMNIRSPGVDRRGPGAEVLTRASPLGWDAGGRFATGAWPGASAGWRACPSRGPHLRRRCPHRVRARPQRWHRARLLSGDPAARRVARHIDPRETSRADDDRAAAAGRDAAPSTPPPRRHRGRVIGRWWCRWRCSARGRTRPATTCPGRRTARPRATRVLAAGAVSGNRPRVHGSSSWTSPSRGANAGQTRRRGYATRRDAQRELTRVLTLVDDRAYVEPKR